MSPAELNVLCRRVVALEVAKSANPPPEKPALPAWMDENLSDVQAIVDDLADRVLSDRGDFLDPGWFAANRSWEDSLPARDVVRYFLRDRMSRSPDGRRMLPHGVACELIGLLADWFKCEDFEQGLNAAWRHLHYLPPTPASQSLVERLWPGAVSPLWEYRLHRDLVPLPGQIAAPQEFLFEEQ
jgi:hypothetical protein